MLRTIPSRVLRTLRRSVCATSARLGAFAFLRDSAWRRHKLLILCYHGISLLDEEEWDRSLFLSPDFFRRRLELIRSSGYAVLSLGEGLARLRAGTLDQPSVVITFDDGTFDFFDRAWPILREFNYPATVYVTTYYSLYNRPVFNPALSYILWKSGGSLPLESLTGANETMDLANEPQRAEAARRIQEFVRAHGLTGAQKDDLLGRTAALAGVDFRDFLQRRILQIMTPAEIAQISAEGADVQLHTHRHRTPSDKRAFTREIQENREILEGLTQRPATHFCYPSGVHNTQMAGWMRELGVASGVTCNPGLAASGDNFMLLPRMVDTGSLTDVEFESFLCGFGFPLIVRRTHGEVEPLPDPV